MPCRCSDVDSGRLFFNTMRTLSPSLTRISGAGTTPLYVHASTNLPGETSHLTTLASRSNSLVPSARTLGSSRSPPCPAVLAGNWAATSAIILSISCHDMVVGVAPALAVPSPPLALPIMTEAVMPLAAWPAISQSAGYMPSATGPTLASTVAPGLMSPVFTPSSGTLKLWTALPLLVTFIVPPSTGREIICGLIANSVSVTSTLADADDVAAPAADPSRKPNIARNSAPTANTSANQPRNDLSARSMPAILVSRQGPA